MVFLAVVPILVIAWTFTVFGTFKRTAKLLSCTTSVAEFAVAVHSKTGFANNIAAPEFFRILCTEFVKRDKTISVIHITNGVVYSFYIIPFVSKKGTFR